MRYPCRFRSCLLFHILLVAVWTNTLGATGSLGIFSQQNDIGDVSRPLTADYDAATGIYTIGASGANMWGAADAFGFVWTQVTGDIALAADIRLLGSSKQANRKACLVFRQSLEPGSVYADVAVHGDGHTSLQFRSEAGGLTRTIQCPVNAPRRVRLEKRGAVVTLSLAGADGVFVPSGCSIQLPLEGSFHVGLAVCAHDNAAFETATFSAVELGAPPPGPATPTSAIEVIALASLDRRVVHRATGRLESPHFSADGRALFFNHEGKIQRVNLDGHDAPVVIDTGFLTRCNNDHGLSPDGTQLVVSDLTETGKSLMYLLPVGGGIPVRINAPDPSYWHGWSPDGQTLAYCGGRDGNYDVYTIPVAGGPERRLTTAPGNDNGPDYSADGQWIYFHSNRTGRMQIWRMRPDGANQEQVTDDGNFNWFPHPSPDGKWIVYLTTVTVPDTGHPSDTEYLLRLMPAGGGATRDIARFAGGQGSLNVPCWSRDSRYIAFATYRPVP